MTWVCARPCKLQKGCTRLAAASHKVYQLLAHCQWFSPASSTTKSGRHDIAKILLKVALSTINQIKSNQIKSSLLTVLSTKHVLADCTDVPDIRVKSLNKLLKHVTGDSILRLKIFYILKYRFMLYYHS